MFQVKYEKVKYKVWFFSCIPFVICVIKDQHLNRWAGVTECHAKDKWDPCSKDNELRAMARAIDTTAKPEIDIVWAGMNTGNIIAINPGASSTMKRVFVQEYLKNRETPEVPF